MLSIVNKFIYIVGAMTVAALFYTSTFFYISNHVIHPYERENLFEPHYLRPEYNVVFYPMRWFIANDSSFKKKSVKVYNGWLREPLTKRDEKDMRSVSVKTFDDSNVSIGFTGNSIVLESFDAIKIGKFVKMTFGRTLSKKGDRFINKLISIEVVNLMDDPRIQSEEFSAEESERVFDIFHTLEGKRKDCVGKFIDSYQSKVFKHCLQAGYADNIGGGCYHIVGYSITSGAVKQALNICDGGS